MLCCVLERRRFLTVNKSTYSGPHYRYKWCSQQVPRLRITRIVVIINKPDVPFVVVRRRRSTNQRRRIPPRSEAEGGAGCASPAKPHPFRGWVVVVVVVGGGRRRGRINSLEEFYFGAFSVIPVLWPRDVCDIIPPIQWIFYIPSHSHDSSSKRSGLLTST